MSIDDGCRGRKVFEFVMCIISAGIGFTLLKNGRRMAELHPRHSIYTYRICGAACIAAAVLCVAYLLTP